MRLGFGFRCGFLGLLHMEIIQQRLEGEADLGPGADGAPNVTYEILTTTGEILSISTTRKKCPIPAQIDEFRQPIVKVNFVLPVDVDRPGDAALHGSPRRVRADRISFAYPGDADLQSCRWPT